MIQIIFNKNIKEIPNFINNGMKFVPQFKTLKEMDKIFRMYLD